MGELIYEPDRLCHTPGTERRGIDFGLKKEKVASTFGDRDDPLTTSWMISLAEAEADAARAREQYAQLLLDSGLSAEEFMALAGYIHDQDRYGITPSEDDLENFILRRRPQTVRHPGVIDPRGRYFPGLQAAAFVTPIVPIVDALAGAALSILLDFVPIIGEIKMVVETAIGRDLVTGDKLALWERLLGPIGHAVGHARKIAKGLAAAAKVMRSVATVTRLRVGVRLLAPLLALVAHMKAPPAEVLRIVDRLAQVDVVALRVAKAEAEAARGGALAMSRAQGAALHDASALLRADEVAQVQRGQTRMAAASDGVGPKPPLKGTEAADDVALPAGAGGKGQGRRPGKSGGRAGRTPPDPTRIYNTYIRKGSAAFQHLLKKGMTRQYLTKKQMRGLPYRYQMHVTKQKFEFVTRHRGKKLQIDGLADSRTSAGKLDIIEAKGGFVDEVELSGHLVYGDKKIDQMQRLAQFAEDNPDQIDKVIIVVGNLTNDKKALIAVGEAYHNLLRAVKPKRLQDLIEIVDEQFLPFKPGKVKAPE